MKPNLLWTPDFMISKGTNAAFAIVPLTYQLAGLPGHQKYSTCMFMLTLVCAEKSDGANEIIFSGAPS